jgi:hypothetical protein
LKKNFPPQKEDPTIVAAAQAAKLENPQLAHSLTHPLNPLQDNGSEVVSERVATRQIINQKTCQGQIIDWAASSITQHRDG